MVRLIDADALKCEMQRLTSNLENTAESMGGQGLLCKRLNTLAEGVQRGIDMLNEQPTIEERKTGKWLYKEEHVTYNDGRRAIYSSWGCSECGTYFDEGCFWHYCPNCGARMVNEHE